MVLEKTLESPLDFKEIQIVHPKGDQSWVFIGRTDAKAETFSGPSDRQRANRGTEGRFEAAVWFWPHTVQTDCLGVSPDPLTHQLW